MFAKVYEFKEVIIFYILLALILFIVSIHNKEIDMNIAKSETLVTINYWVLALLLITKLCYNLFLGGGTYAFTKYARCKEKKYTKSKLYLWK